MSKYNVLLSIILIHLFLGIQGAAVLSDNHVPHNTPDLGIVNGHEVSPPHSQPYNAALLYGAKGHFCGGSLISTNFVLTAAHCILVSPPFQLTKKPNITVVLGAHNWTTVEDGQVRMTVYRPNMTLHPTYYGPADYEHDIAVLGLPQAVTLTPQIQPAPLPTFQTPTESSYQGTAYGWGGSFLGDNSSAVLRYADFKVTYDPKDEPFFINRVVNKVGSCGGDSGGPLIANGMQIGVGVFVTDQNCTSGEDGYISVMHFLSWINSTTDVNIH